MKRFAIYKTESGVITRIISCPESMAAIQVGDGEGVLIAEDLEITDATHHVVSGEIMPIE